MLAVERLSVCRTLLGLEGDFGYVGSGLIVTV